MPVRSLTSSVLKWPDRESVEAAVREWAETVIEKTSTVTRVGYGGSLAGEEWGFGSDVDLIVILSSSSSPFFERGPTVRRHASARSCGPVCLHRT